MFAANGVQFTTKSERSGGPGLSAATTEYLARYDLDGSKLPVYHAENSALPVEIVRLEPHELERIPEVERPRVITERNGREHLLYFPVDG